jgi:hypothetical protein
VHEHVAATVIGLNETKTLLGVKPLYSSLRHSCSPDQPDIPKKCPPGESHGGQKQGSFTVSIQPRGAGEVPREERPIAILDGRVLRTGG